MLLLFLVADIPAAEAQYIPGKLSNEAKVSILTLGPAKPAYTIFGHTAIRLNDPANHIDRVYNYGTFDFDGSNFYLKFLYGDLRYFLSKTSFRQFNQTNTALGRSIVSQTLNLSQSQINTLVQRLEQNMLPENRSYRYGFFSQNCVTKVYDLLSAMNLGPSFNQTQATTLSTSTYRQKIAPYLAHRPWMQLGINLMLGAETDRSLNDHKRQFLPDDLHLFLANSSGVAGKQLVQSSKTIAEAQPIQSQSSIPPILIFWGFFLMVVAFTATSLIQGWQSWWLDRFLFGVVGITGLIIAFGALISHHPALHHNWNLLWALPTHLLMAVKVRSFSRNKWLRFYFWITIALNGAILAAGAALPQQLPVAIFPLIAGLTVRSAYRIYIAKRLDNADIRMDTTTIDANNNPSIVNNRITL